MKNQEKKDTVAAADFGIVIFGSCLLAAFLLLLALFWVGANHEAIAFARACVIIAAIPVWLIFLISQNDEPEK